MSVWALLSEWPLGLVASDMPAHYKRMMAVLSLRHWMTAPICEPLLSASVLAFFSLCSLGDFSAFLFNGRYASYSSLNIQSAVALHPPSTTRCLKWGDGRLLGRAHPALPSSPWQPHTLY